MLKKIAAVAIVASLIAGPAFAQGVLQPAAPNAAVTTGIPVKETGSVTTPARKHITVVKHNRKHVRHYGHAKKHTVHVKKAKHVKHAKVHSTRHIVKM